MVLSLYSSGSGSHAEDFMGSVFEPQYHSKLVDLLALTTSLLFFSAMFTGTWVWACFVDGSGGTSFHNAAF